jgi:hypothetical protein
MPGASTMRETVITISPGGSALARRAAAALREPPTVRRRRRAGHDGYRARG